MHKHRSVVVICALGLAVRGMGQGPSLRILHFSVGNGDSTFVIEPSVPAGVQNLLIDGGSNTAGGSVVIAGLRQEGIQRLDFAVATHYDPNHRDGDAAEIATVK
jgi:beta-lactamase superfamily II metal-dependent hydrolase